MYRDRIKQIYNHLSPSYRKVADFLLDNYREAAFLNASSLAQHLKVDPATVVRFSQRLGYPGYPELADEVRGIVKEEFLAERAPAVAGSVSLTIPESVRQDIQNLEEFLVRNPTGVLSQIADQTRRARSILAVSEGTGVHLVAFFVEQLRLAGRQAEVIPLDGAQSAQVLAGIGSGDLVIGIGYSHYATDVAAILRVADEMGAETIGLAESLTSPVAMAARTVLQVPQKAIGPLASMASVLGFLSATAQSVCLENRPDFVQQTGGSTQTFSSLAAKRNALVRDQMDNASQG
ncbi:MAG: MurR/RpiR family transcriptional regulator [Anaerolineae bacterium]|nr:MurR/RpiR family transcriptional regulator [Anaerolineae bacterium]